MIARQPKCLALLFREGFIQQLVGAGLIVAGQITGK